MKYVLDTNVVIAALNGNDAVRARLATIAPGDVCLAVVVLAELLHGARRSRRSAENLARLNALADTLATLDVDRAVAERYGVVRAQLESRGRPKSDFDLVIACTALTNDATLVTHDHGLLDGEISELRTEDWLA